MNEKLKLLPIVIVSVPVVIWTQFIIWRFEKEPENYWPHLVTTIVVLTATWLLTKVDWTRPRKKIENDESRSDNETDQGASVEGINRFAKYRGIGRIGQGSTLEEIVDEVRSMRDDRDDRTTEVPDRARDGDK